MSYPSSPDSLVRDQRLDDPEVADPEELRAQECRDLLLEIVDEQGPRWVLNVLVENWPKVYAEHVRRRLMSSRR